MSISLKSNYPNQSIGIFVAPSSLPSVLKKKQSDTNLMKKIKKNKKKTVPFIFRVRTGALSLENVNYTKLRHTVDG